MTHEPLEILKIAAVALAAAGALGLVSGFYEGADAGKRAFAYALPLTGLFGTLQVVDSSRAVWAILAWSAAGLLIHRALKRRR